MGLIRNKNTVIRKVSYEKAFPERKIAAAHSAGMSMVLNGAETAIKGNTSGESIFVLREKSITGDAAYVGRDINTAIPGDSAVSLIPVSAGDELAVYVGPSVTIAAGAVITTANTGIWAAGAGGPAIALESIVTTADNAHVDVVFTRDVY